MNKESKVNFPEEELAAELAALQEELGDRFAGNGTAANDSVWIFRQFHGVNVDEWETLASKHDLGHWLTLPMDGDTYPHLKHLQETLERLAYQTEHDSLTGVANRRAFDRILGIEMERARRAKSPLSLAIFDLDDFKSVNDLYGHSKGDEVLRAFAGLLKASTRPYDLAARYGGEEFALIMPGSGIVKAQRLLTRLLEEFRQVDFSTPEGDATFNVTCSVGLACYKGTAEMILEELLDLADGALYEAKQAGKDRVHVARMPLVEEVFNETLVRANEKQFLFGGK